MKCYGSTAVSKTARPGSIPGTYASNRLRKYLRKKRRATDPKKFDRLAKLYWRYHFKVHGAHLNLWANEIYGATTKESLVVLAYR